MIRIVTRLNGALVMIALLVGCISTRPDAGIDAVRQTVESRSGHPIYWNQGTAADKAVADSVRAILHKNPLGVDDAVQVALLNNLNLQATYEDLGIAQTDLVAAGLLRNPTLSAEVRFPDLPALPYQINLTQSFIDLLMMPMRKRAAGALFEAERLRVTHQVLDTAADVSAAFFRAQGTNQLVEMRRQIVDATDASLEAARSLHDAGNINDLEFANQQAMHEQAKVDLAQAQASALDAREELNGLMGVWGPNTDWEIAARLPDLPPTEIAPTGLESLAIFQRTDLAATRQQVEAAAQGIGLTRYAALSDLNAGVHIEKDTDGSLTAGPGIEIPLPIFNQGQSAFAAAEARFRQSRFRYLSLAVEIRAQVRQKRNDMISARQRAAYYTNVILPLRHQIVQQTQLHYNAMTLGVFQLIESKQAEIEAGRDYVQALQDYWVARSELERVVEGRLEPAACGTSGPSIPLH